MESYAYSEVPASLRFAEGGSGEARSAGAARKRDAHGLLWTIEEMYAIRDLDVLLERVLFEARRFVGADAGTLYLRSEDRLFFRFVQNDTLFPGGVLGASGVGESSVYSDRSMPVDRTSLAGYIAATGESLLIDDVYHIRSGVSYAFNPAFDEGSAYRTRSMLIVPLKARDGAVIGVLQLINALDAGGDVVPFSGADRIFILQFARSAANAIEQARLSQEAVLRMVELAALRDPHETSAHALRVGAYSAELYGAWARRHGVSAGELQRTRQILRTAAMLHDVGKVAVSDTILKKPDRLTPAELAAVRMHVIYGARLFPPERSALDRMSFEVALGHHERWDGRGYPGKVDDVRIESVPLDRGLRGEAIPLAARIVAIADVYDALGSPRAYKAAWDRERVLRYIASESGRQFDPELVETFLGMLPALASIREGRSS